MNIYNHQTESALVIVWACAYIGQVSQFNLQVGLDGLGLRPDSDSNDLGVHDCVVPETPTKIWQKE